MATHRSPTHDPPGPFVGGEVIGEETPEVGGELGSDRPACSNASPRQVDHRFPPHSEPMVLVERRMRMLGFLHVHVWGSPLTARDQ